MFDVKQSGFIAVRRAHFAPHRRNLVVQGGAVARAGNHGVTHGLKARLQIDASQHATGTGDGLVFPGPCGVGAPLFLVIGIGAERRHQHAGIAIGAQRGVDFVQIAFAGFHGEPVDQLAHQCAINLCGPIVGIVVDKHDVQVAAVAQLLAAQLAIGNDRQLWHIAMAHFEARPAPSRGDAQHGFGQGAQVVGHLLYAELAFNVPGQRTKHFGMVGPAQQVEQGFVVVFAAGYQRTQSVTDFGLKGGRIKALFQHFAAGQFVDHPRVGLQVTGGPTRGAQHAQQTFVHQRAFVQQREIAFAAQQSLHPVHQTHARQLGRTALFHPLGCSLHQLQEARP